MRAPAPARSGLLGSTDAVLGNALNAVAASSLAFSPVQGAEDVVGAAWIRELISAVAMDTAVRDLAESMATRNEVSVRKSSRPRWRSAPGRRPSCTQDNAWPLRGGVRRFWR